MSPRLRFSRGSGLAGWAVRFATFSSFAHVGLELAPGVVMDSYPGIGTSIREVSDAGQAVAYFEISAPDGVLDQVIALGKQELGQRYDWLACAGFALRCDWRLPGFWDCSEWMADLFRRALWPLIRTEHLDRVTPADLLLSPYLRPSAP